MELARNSDGDVCSHACMRACAGASVTSWRRSRRKSKSLCSLRSRPRAAAAHAHMCPRAFSPTLVATHSSLHCLLAGPGVLLLRVLDIQSCDIGGAGSCYATSLHQFTRLHARVLIPRSPSLPPWLDLPYFECLESACELVCLARAVCRQLTGSTRAGWDERRDATALGRHAR